MREKKNTENYNESQNFYELFSENTQAIVYGAKKEPVQRMLDFDFICRRKKPSVAAVVDPITQGFITVFWGSKEILVPVYNTLGSASDKHPKADVLINFSSFRSAYSSSMDAITLKPIRTIIIIAEGIPERRTRQLIAEAKKRNKVIIGPATVGGITAGKFKIGNTAGTIDNIISSKLYRPGCVGFVSKSGGMSNECYNIIAKNTNGLYEGIAIGGDRFAGSTLLDHMMRFEKNPMIKMLVALGEVGGKDEYDIADAVNAGKIKKPVVMWVTGTCAKLFPTNVQFGHAGAMASSNLETADAKNKALKDAGVIVPDSFDDFDIKIRQTYEKLKKQKIVEDIDDSKIIVPYLPMDYKDAIAEGKIRKPISIICTISDDRGEEATYCGRPISEFVEKKTIGDVIAALWFKKNLPKFATEFIEKVIITLADHGPCVSGAHNAIVTSRAGKDLVSCLCSGLLTVGPRFGGAIDGAAKYFKYGKDKEMTAKEFVDYMKERNMLIPGIGHRIKTADNPDRRVSTLKIYAKSNFKSTEYLDYALEVEKVTTAKRNTLILNVDGGVGVLFLDLMKSCDFSEEEINSIVEHGYLNGFFLLARSIGLIGHSLDQKQLKAELYRTSYDDVLFLGNNSDS